MTGVSDPTDPEDRKIITLARAARARTQAAQGAAVRDTDGRTYAATSIALPTLQLSATQLAVAMAVSSGAPGLEAVAVVGQPATHAGSRQWRQRCITNADSMPPGACAFSNSLNAISV